MTSAPAPPVDLITREIAVGGFAGLVGRGSLLVAAMLGALKAGSEVSGILAQSAGQPR